MKDCKKIHPLLSLFAEGELSGAESRSVEAHLKECPPARRELEELRRLAKALKAMPEPKVPSDLHERIMARVEGRSASPVKKRSVWLLPSWGLAAAAVLTFIFLKQDPNWRQTYKYAPKTQGKDEMRSDNGPKVLAQVELSKTSETSTVIVPKEDERTKYAAEAPQMDEESMKQKKAETVDRVSRNLVMAEGSGSAGKAENEKDLGVSETQPSAEDAAAAAKPVQEAPAAMPSAAGAGANEAQGNLTLQSASPARRPMTRKAVSGPDAGQLNTSAIKAFSTEQTWSGDQGASMAGLQELVTDPVVFQRYWQSLQGEKTPPELDFSTQAVVVLLAGVKPTPGYSIRMTRLEETPDQVIIHYVVIAPPQDAVLAQVVTRPWSMQVVPKPSKPAVFQKDE